VAAGLLASAPTAAAGWADFAEGHEEQQRVGLVHAGLNVCALACYGGALLRRRGGRRGGRVLTAAGGALGGLSAALGGHLSFRLASGANHAEEVQHVGPGEWQPVGPVSELPADTPVRRIIGDIPALVLRRNGASSAGNGAGEGAQGGADEVTVLSDRCPHLSAPLHEGELSSVDGELCITCPWHSSVFQVSDGAVVHGPATAPVPRFETRIVNGTLQARVRTLPGVDAS
jgi:nitrite reductase/ring-hydroxylating ferredoxin subunit